MISKALENAVEAVVNRCMPDMHFKERFSIERVHIDNLKEELDRYRAERETLGEQKMQKEPAIRTIVHLLRSRFKLSEVFSDAEIAAAWANSQGFPMSEQMDVFCDFLGISNDGE